MGFNISFPSDLRQSNMNKFLALVCLAGAGAFAMPQGHGIPAHLLAKRLQGQDTTADEQLLIAEGTPIVVPVGFAAVAEVANCQTGEIIPVDAGNLDINGCLVGACGERVCPLGAIGVSNESVNHRGNKGPGQTGSNGNSGPVSADGRPIDPAAQTYLKQIEAYKLWEKQQEENNKKIIG